MEIAISIYLENRNNLFLQLIKNFREIKIFNIQNQYKKNFDFNEIRLNQLYKFNVIYNSFYELIIKFF